MAPKLRVYQLARELNRDNSEIIRELQHMGVPVTSHSNTVEDRLADALRRKLGVYEEEPVKAKAKEAAAPPEDPPGVRPNGAYLAYLRDPDGHKIVGVARPAS